MDLKAVTMVMTAIYELLRFVSTEVTLKTFIFHQYWGVSVIISNYRG